MVRTVANTASPTGQLTYVRMQDWDVLSSNNDSLIGAYRRDTNIQQIDYSNNYQNEAFNQKQFQMISWSADPVNAFSHGQNAGYAILTGNEKLSITTPAGLASTSYQIDIRAYIHANLVYEKGQFKIDRD